MRVKFASRILFAAAQDVRDPIQLKVAALLEIEGELHQSYARFRRLRQRVEKAEAADSRRAFPAHREIQPVEARARSLPPPLSPQGLA
jgi:hypothetical protein